MGAGAALLKQQTRPANGNQAKHRYAGLLTCQECGNTFIPMICCWNGKSRVEYVCRGYHRNGKTYCASHRIHEEVLDAAVVYRNCARAVCRGTKEAGTAAKNVGVEETNPRRPHFVVTGENTGTGVGNR